jgi:hypothetical protein
MPALLKCHNCGRSIPTTRGLRVPGGPPLSVGVAQPASATTSIVERMHASFLSCAARLSQGSRTGLLGSQVRQGLSLMPTGQLLRLVSASAAVWVVLLWLLMLHDATVTGYVARRALSGLCLWRRRILRYLNAAG